MKTDSFALSSKPRRLPQVEHSRGVLRNWSFWSRRRVSPHWPQVNAALRMKGWVPDAELLEGGDAELGKVVSGGFQGGAGEVGVEGVEVLEVDGEGFLSLNRHL